MMDKKQTALEWVIQYLNNVKPDEFCSIEKIKELLKQAMHIEKEQIEKAYFDCLSDCYWYRDTTELKDESEIYYNQTYGQK